MTTLRDLKKGDRATVLDEHGRVVEVSRVTRAAGPKSRSLCVDHQQFRLKDGSGLDTSWCVRVYVEGDEERAKLRGEITKLTHERDGATRDAAWKRSLVQDRRKEIERLEREAVELEHKAESAITRLGPLHARMAELGDR